MSLLSLTVPVHHVTCIDMVPYVTPSMKYTHIVYSTLVQTASSSEPCQLGAAPPGLSSHIATATDGSAGPRDSYRGSTSSLCFLLLLLPKRASRGVTGTPALRQCHTALHKAGTRASRSRSSSTVLNNPGGPFQARRAARSSLSSKASEYRTRTRVCSRLDLHV